VVGGLSIAWIRRISGGHSTGFIKYSDRYLYTHPIRDNDMRLYEKIKIGCVTVSVMTLYVSQALLFVGNRVGVLSQFSWILNTNKYKKLIHVLPGNLLRLSEKRELVTCKAHIVSILLL
jgi:hypothetical protein